MSPCYISMRDMLEETQFAVRIRRANLESALRSAQTCVAGRPAVPILGYALLETEGDNLSIRSTDLTQSLRVTIPCTVEKPGAVALRARRFLDLVGSLAQGEVSLSAKGNSFVAISMGGLRATMPGLPGANFPASFVPCTEWMARFHPGALAGLIGRVLPTIGEENEEAGLALGCALLRLTPAGVLMVTTDRYRMARAEMRTGTPSPEDRDILLPRRLLRTLLSLFPVIGDAPVDLGLTEKAIFFRGGSYMLAARRVAGRFPAFEPVIPSWRYEVVVSTSDMLAAVNRLSGFDDNPVAMILFDIQGHTLELRARTPGAYEAVEQLSVEWLGADTRFCLRAHCLMSCLPPLRCAERVVFGIPDRAAGGPQERVPIALTAKAGDPYDSLYLLMPTAVTRGAEERTHARATS